MLWDHGLNTPSERDQFADEVGGLLDELMADSNLLVAGALSGVFRSKDGGKEWSRISPENHSDLINVESVAGSA